MITRFLGLLFLSFCFQHASAQQPSSADNAQVQTEYLNVVIYRLEQALNRNSVLDLHHLKVSILDNVDLFVVDQEAGDVLKVLLGAITELENSHNKAEAYELELKSFERELTNQALVRISSALAEKAFDPVFYTALIASGGLSAAEVVAEGYGKPSPAQEAYGFHLRKESLDAKIELSAAEKNGFLAVNQQLISAFQEHSQRLGSDRLRVSKRQIDQFDEALQSLNNAVDENDVISAHAALSRIETHFDAFPPFQVAMARAEYVTGRQSAASGRLLSFAERQSPFRTRIFTRQALTLVLENGTRNDKLRAADKLVSHSSNLSEVEYGLLFKTYAELLDERLLRQIWDRVRENEQQMILAYVALRASGISISSEDKNSLFQTSDSALMRTFELIETTGLHSGIANDTDISFEYRTLRDDALSIQVPGWLKDAAPKVIALVGDQELNVSWDDENGLVLSGSRGITRSDLISSMPIGDELRVGFGLDNHGIYFRVKKVSDEEFALVETCSFNGCES